jgi:hypothetical protein
VKAERPALYAEKYFEQWSVNWISPEGCGNALLIFFAMVPYLPRMAVLG